jgi:hypothetical protein
MRCLDIINLGHGLSVDRDMELTVDDALDGVDRHVQVFVLALLPDEEIVGMNLPDITEKSTTETTHGHTDGDLVGAVWVERHRCAPSNSGK